MVNLPHTLCREVYCLWKGLVLALASDFVDYSGLLLLLQEPSPNLPVYLPVIILYRVVEFHFVRPSVFAEQVTDSLLQGRGNEA